MADRLANPSVEPVLELRGLHHTFRGGADAVIALRGVDLTLAAGAFVVVVGPNGSGKSTLLDVVAGSVVPNRGSVRLGGEDATRWTVHRRARVVGRVFQNPFTGTAPHLTVAENLALANRRAAGTRKLRRALDRRLRGTLRDRLASLGMRLEDRLDTPAESLSRG